jgi:RNA polymerase sigma factor (sigma-70 family)
VIRDGNNKELFKNREATRCVLISGSSLAEKQGSTMPRLEATRCVLSASVQYLAGEIDEAQLFIATHLPHLVTRIRELRLDVSSTNLTIGQFARKILDLFLVDGCQELMKFRGYPQQEFLDYLDNTLINCREISGMLKIIAGDVVRGSEDFFNAYESYMTGIAGFMLKNTDLGLFGHEASDLVHAVVEKLWCHKYRAFRNFQRRCSFKTYLGKLMKNEVSRLFRLHGVRRKNGMAMESDDDNGAKSGQATSLTSMWVSFDVLDSPDLEMKHVLGSDDGPWQPDKHLELQQSQKLVERALSDLNPNHRAVAKLRYHEDMPYTEIAAELETNLNTVNTWASRGREELRRIIPVRHRELMWCIPNPYRDKLFRKNSTGRLAAARAKSRSFF